MSCAMLVGWRADPNAQLVRAFRVAVELSRGHVDCRTSALLAQVRRCKLIVHPQHRALGLCHRMSLPEPAVTL